MKLLKLTFVFILLWFGIYFLTALLIVLVFQQKYTDVVINPLFLIVGGLFNCCICGIIVDNLYRTIN
jgi:hypothetical protein